MYRRGRPCAGLRSEAVLPFVGVTAHSLWRKCQLVTVDITNVRYLNCVLCRAVKRCCWCVSWATICLAESIKRRVGRVMEHSVHTMLAVQADCQDAYLSVGTIYGVDRAIRVNFFYVSFTPVPAVCVVVGQLVRGLERMYCL